MSDAYVLIMIDVGRQAQVVLELAQIPGVATAAAVTGAYDAIVRVGGDDVYSLEKLVVAKIEAVEGVTRTAICRVVHL